MYIYTKKCGNEIILKANVVDVEELVCVSVMYGFSVMNALVFVDIDQGIH